jgi:hypothetical protein
MTDKARYLPLGALLLVVALAACAGVLFTAPPGSTINLIASPPFVASDGGVSVITAIVIEPAGTTVSDGTVVLFFTDIGSIEPQGKTRNGIARVNFTSDSRSGVAHIQAVSGGSAQTIATSPSSTTTPTTVTSAAGGSSGTGSAQIDVPVGNARVKTVCCIRADPPRITVSNSTHVFARVIDGSGNGIANVPVFFDVVPASNTGNEFFDIQGPVFTNQSGEAENVLRTRRDSSGIAEVRARAIGGGVEVVSETLPIPVLR